MDRSCLVDIKVEGFIPNWFVQLKADVEATPYGFGSKAAKTAFQDLPLIGAGMLDFIPGINYHMERYHRYDRPYPISDPLFHDVPLVGPLLGATVGSVLKPPRQHPDLHLYTTDAGAEPWATAETYGAPIGRGTFANPVYAFGGSVDAGYDMNAGASLPEKPTGVRQTISQLYYRNIIEAPGLAGFLTEQVFGRPFGGDTVWQGSGALDSTTSRFWNAQVGGLMTLTEPIRRLYPAPMTSQEYVNPIRNRMDHHWLPEKFLYGDPYCLLPDTPVDVGGALLPAKDIKIGSRIIIKRGEFSHVRAIAVREVDEEVYGIVHKGWMLEPLWVTGGHPFFIKREAGRTAGKWIEAKDLRPGDCVLYSIASKEPDRLDLKPFAPPTWLALDEELIPPNETANIFPRYLDLDVAMGQFIGITLRIAELYNDRVIYPAEKLTLDEYRVVRQVLQRLVKSGRAMRLFQAPKTIETRAALVVNLARHFKNSAIYPAIALRGPAVCVEGFIRGMFPAHLYPWRNIDKLILEDIEEDKLYLLWSLLTVLTLHAYVVLHPETGHPTLRLNNDSAMFLQYTRNQDSGPVFRDWGGLPRVLTCNLEDHVSFMKFEILEIQKKHYKGPVYAFEVPQWASFTLPGAVAHNSTVSKGQFRLPGAAYEMTHEVRLTFPTGASKLGYDTVDLALDLAGYKDAIDDETFDTLAGGTRIHRIIQRQLAEHNLLISAESEAYDPWLDVGSPIDAIIRGPHGDPMMVEIKTAKPEIYAKILREGPQYKNVVQANWYLRQLRHDKGILLYVNRENPSQMQAFQIRYNPKLYRKAVENLQAARMLAAEIRQPGEGYSWADRLSILADIAPTGEEFQNVFDHVMTQARSGLLSDTDLMKVDTAKQRREAILRRYDLYPRRFSTLHDIFEPSSQYQQMSMNENIKAAAEYSLPERVAGGIWEWFGGLRTPLHTKLLPLYDPMAQYERFSLYGEESALWNDPYRDFIEPYYRGWRGKTGHTSGFIAGAQFNFLLTGKPVGAFTLASSAYGLLHGGYRALTGTTYIPKSVAERREIWKMYDELKYSRARYLYAATGDEQWETEMERTLSGMRENDRFDISKAIPALMAEERPFLIPFINAPEYQRDEIRAKVSPMLREILEAQWNNLDADENHIPGLPHHGAAQVSREYTNPYYQGQGNDRGFRSPWRGIEPTASPLMRPLLPPDWRSQGDALSAASAISVPDSDWEGWSPSTNLEDILVKTTQEEGYDAHDFGLGWQQQQRRMDRHPVEAAHPAKFTEQLSSALQDVQQLRSAIASILRTFGGYPTISLIPTPGKDDEDVLEINLVYNRQDELQAMLTNTFNKRAPLWR